MLLQALMGPCRAKICGDEQAVFPQLLRRLSLQLPSARANCEGCQQQLVENVSLVVIAERPLQVPQIEYPTCKALRAQTPKSRKSISRLIQLCVRAPPPPPGASLTCI